MTKQKTRVLIAKMGLDGQDRGALVLSMGLRDEGMEVLYTGLHQSPEKVAEIALQEDVDIVGVSSLVDAHRTLVPELISELRKRNKGEVPLLLGGFIQPEDIPDLKREGVTEVFGLDTKISDITNWIKFRMADLSDKNKLS